MAENEKSWWQTLPGVLSGLAALITAITGTLIAADKIGLFKHHNPADSNTLVEVNKYGTPFFMNRIVTRDDLQGRTHWELDVMRNEVYARHGRRFSRLDLQKHFNEQPWYEPKYMPGNFPVNILTGIQKTNVAFISSYQTQMKK